MRWQMAAALLALLAAACAPSASPPQAPPRAESEAIRESPLDPASLRLVERAVDGDTLVLAGGERVRVLGIDTPELSHADAAVRAVAEEARRELAAMSEGRRLRVVAGLPDEPRDRHGRLLAYVEQPDAAIPDLGERLIASGLARPYPSPHPRAERYRELAAIARREGRGLWAAPVARAMNLLPEAEIDCGAAALHEGRRVRLRGRLEPGPRGERVQRLLLRCDGGELDVIVFPSRYDEIPAELVSRWAEAGIAITGEISVHRGRHQVILEDPFQVEAPDP